MTKDTKRDRVWSAALTKAFAGRNFSVGDVRERAGLDESSDRTVRDVLNTMVETEWLEKERKQSHVWFAGRRIDDDLAACEDCGVVRGLDHLDDRYGDRSLCWRCRIRASPPLRDLARR